MRDFSDKRPSSDTLERSAETHYQSSTEHCVTTSREGLYHSTGDDNRSTTSDGGFSAIFVGDPRGGDDTDERSQRISSRYDAKLVSIGVVDGSHKAWI